MTSIRDHKMPHGAAGLVLHQAALYDLTVWLMLLGGERAFRNKLLEPARLARGESVLDVGCGTGSLALAAKRQVGPDGRVVGIDASADMLARAARKAEKSGLEIAFKQAAAQALPFPDTQFDVVCSSLMLHHLPRKDRAPCAREMARVLRRGGRLLVVEFAPPAQQGTRRPLLPGFHRHGHVKLEHIVALLEDAGLKVRDRGAIKRNLHFALATKFEAG